jgi:hypothetical protein
MSILATLVPGLRASRAPLAAGALWLLALWLAVEPSLPKAGEKTTGLIGSLLAVDDVIGSVGASILLGFAAYLMGSLSEALLDDLRSMLAAARRLSLLEKRETILAVTARQKAEGSSFRGTPSEYFALQPSWFARLVMLTRFLPPYHLGPEATLRQACSERSIEGVERLAAARVATLRRLLSEKVGTSPDNPISCQDIAEALESQRIERTVRSWLERVPATTSSLAIGRSSASISHLRRP